VPKYRCQCRECGGFALYADSSTYSVADKDPDRLSTKLSEMFEVMADYSTANRLKVNSDKTHLIIRTTAKKRRKPADLLFCRRFLISSS
jgi:hypothetical protein